MQSYTRLAAESQTLIRNSEQTVCTALPPAWQLTFKAMKWTVNILLLLAGLPLASEANAHECTPAKKDPGEAKGLGEGEGRGPATPLGWLCTFCAWTSFRIEPSSAPSPSGRSCAIVLRPCPTILTLTDGICQRQTQSNHYLAHFRTVAASTRQPTKRILNNKKISAAPRKTEGVLETPFRSHANEKWKTVSKSTAPGSTTIFRWKVPGRAKWRGLVWKVFESKPKYPQPDLTTWDKLKCCFASKETLRVERIKCWS